MTGLADFTPFHSLAGGLMMASSLHTLLSKLGLVLGISGFFHSTVSSALNVGKAKKQESVSIFPLVARYFSAGIFLGGVVLGLARSSIEAGLNVPILDDFSSAKQASLGTVAALGALVGFGTKVSDYAGPVLNS